MNHRRDALDTSSINDNTFNRRYSSPEDIPNASKQIESGYSFDASGTFAAGAPTRALSLSIAARAAATATISRQQQQQLQYFNGVGNSTGSANLMQPPPPPPSSSATPSLCRICGKGEECGRPLLRFAPMQRDQAAAHAAPNVSTFLQDIALHVFCGKTASILPTVNAPDLEILTKAGLKNKHGIGPEVHAALARTRSAVVRQQQQQQPQPPVSNNAKDNKEYYLVREFEAHLAAVRKHSTMTATERHKYQQQQQQQQPQQAAAQTQTLDAACQQQQQQQQQQKKQLQPPATQPLPVISAPPVPSLSSLPMPLDPTNSSSSSQAYPPLTGGNNHNMSNNYNLVSTTNNISSNNDPFGSALASFANSFPGGFIGGTQNDLAFWGVVNDALGTTTSADDANVNAIADQIFGTQNGTTANTTTTSMSTPAPPIFAQQGQNLLLGDDDQIMYDMTANNSNISNTNTESPSLEQLEQQLQQAMAEAVDGIQEQQQRQQSLHSSIVPGHEIPSELPQQTQPPSPPPHLSPQATASNIDTVNHNTPSNHKKVPVKAAAGHGHRKHSLESNSHSNNCNHHQSSSIILLSTHSSSNSNNSHNGQHDDESFDGGSSSIAETSTNSLTMLPALGSDEGGGGGVGGSAAMNGTGIPPAPGAVVMSDGKVRCACGGKHMALGTAKGLQSWKNHVTTKRHQKWMEDNGMIGAV